MTSKSGASLRLTHLHLENWRNFTLVDAPLQRRVFLVGPNASGKSNLLDAVRFLRDVVAVGGGFQEAITSRGGVSKLRSLSARRYPDVVVRVKIGDDSAPDLWEYEVRFSQDNRARPIIKSELVRKSGTQIALRPDERDEGDPERLTQTYLEQVNANRDFREVADFLASVRYLHIVPQLIREPDRSVGRSNDPYGGDFLEQIAKTPDRTRRARLSRILEALKVAVPQLHELELWRDPDRGTPHLRGKYVHWRPQGSWQTEEQFSDGTLRLTGLLWAVLDGTGPLLLEEPELSLHPEVVRHVPQMLARTQRKSGRQVLLSTHSADLLRDQGIGLDEVLLLLPDTEGTSVRPASSFDEIKALLDSGLSMADAVIPRTSPEQAEQLALFGG
jgi:predicted ATPase